MPIHYTTLVLDANAFFKVAPSQIAQYADKFVTIPEVLQEIKDRQSKSALVDGQLHYDLTTRSPSDEAVVAVTTFSKRTGDYPVLSRTDIRLIALAWTLEKEENGMTNLKSDPQPIRVNQGKQHKQKKQQQHSNSAGVSGTPSTVDSQKLPVAAEQAAESVVPDESVETNDQQPDDQHEEAQHDDQEESSDDEDNEVVEEDSQTKQDESLPTALTPLPESAPESAKSDDDDDEGWITPSNIQRYKDRQNVKVSQPKNVIKEISVGCMTSDFAMQNVMMQMNIKVVSGDGLMIRSVRNSVLRCHACYKITRDMDKKFCPSCGNATLLRTSIGVDADGNVTVYLKKNFQYNTRGTVYSIPQPKGGRNKNGVILREDQREYTRALQSQARRERQQELFDDLPIDRIKSRSTEIKIGMGKNPNEAKRRARR
ncbi:hypothetical protein SmJEL517_g03410 [Synchytrium microbalum]|uniref:20S-pre-rRNA D-site endonuclease NOB1 n=1 Tax=Synchytrium microbalum TaxID=1806994 RepID=A0A507BWQ9_9FUNG|nr:uncharacterized protein SmJEL517_g03410 [Synchytrium microbalum]TPX33780.1 hypothetical protein SmJEL517_g03410 [Synchytrium microbalum]